MALPIAYHLSSTCDIATSEVMETSIKLFRKSCSVHPRCCSGKKMNCKKGFLMRGKLKKEVAGLDWDLTQAMSALLCWRAAIPMSNMISNLCPCPENAANTCRILINNHSLVLLRNGELRHPQSQCSKRLVDGRIFWTCPLCFGAHQVMKLQIIPNDKWLYFSSLNCLNNIWCAHPSSLT